MKSSNTGSSTIRVLNWSQLVWGLAFLLFGALLVTIGVLLTWQWFTAKYTLREFVPYRTALAHTEPGSSFNPGYPSVVVPMEQFRKESADKPYMLSYPTQPSYLSSVHYLMVKSTEAGNIYLVSSEKIPHYESFTYGSPGYHERTVYVPERFAFVSVLDGTSYLLFFWIFPLCFIGAIFLLVSMVFFDEAVGRES